MIKAGQVYRHYKGEIYEVLGVAAHSETNESLVLYRRADMSEPRIWARPEKMWHDTIFVKATNPVDSSVVKRFTLVKDTFDSRLALCDFS